MFTERVLNLCQRRWVEQLKDYNMNVQYNPDKANVVADALSRMSMASRAHVEDGKKELVKDIHRLGRLGLRLVDTTSGGVSIHPSYESSFVVEVNEGQDIYPMLMQVVG